MIKVGDYIKHKDNGMIYKVVSSSEKLLYVTDFKQTWQHIGVDVATNNFIVVDYKQLYEQQKQRADELEDVIKRYHDEALKEIKRADELERRWSEMKERMEREQKEAFSKGYIDYDALSYVLEVMRDLEEDNNARSK